MANSNKAVSRKDPAETRPFFYNEFDRLMDNYFNHGWSRFIGPVPGINDLWGTFEMRSPSMDLIDRDNEIVVRVELPGVDKKDLDVSISDNTLTIKGISGKEFKEEKGDYYRSEIRKGSLSRTITLPPGIDSSKVDTRFKNGLLELTIPKTVNSKRKTIKVT